MVEDAASLYGRKVGLFELQLQLQLQWQRSLISPGPADLHGVLQMSCIQYEGITYERDCHSAPLQARASPKYALLCFSMPCE